jgi:hypothetical protein
VPYCTSTSTLASCGELMVGNDRKRAERGQISEKKAEKGSIDRQKAKGHMSDAGWV